MKARVSPKHYDCGHWSSNKYYYEDSKTSKTLCDECYQKIQLVKASKINKDFSEAFFKATSKIR